MQSRVTDFSPTTMRINSEDYWKLTNDQRELLRVYANRNWQEKGDFCFEVGSYRVAEIQKAGMALAHQSE